MATFVISVGGSTIVPGGVVNVSFLRGLKKAIQVGSKAGHRFVIICGGGGTCRNYQKGLKEAASPTREDLDWLGIAVTRLNALLVKSVLKELAHPDLIDGDPLKANLSLWKKPVLMAGGLKPGRSSDNSAVLFAKKVKAKTVVNISNIDYLYTKDPNKYKNAEIIEEINWKDFRKMIGSKWTPGMHVPFDPVASKLAQQEKIDVLLVGSNVKNLVKVFDDKPFKGTVIHS